MNQKKLNKTGLFERLSLPFRRFMKHRKSLTRRERRNQNGLIVFCIACVVVLCSFVMLIWYNMYLIKDLDKQQVALQKEQTQLVEQEDTLKHDVKLLKNDDYVLKLARQRFLYSKDGELVFAISDDDDDNTNGGQINNIETDSKNEMIGAEKDNPRSSSQKESSAQMP